MTHFLVAYPLGATRFLIRLEWQRPAGWQRQLCQTLSWCDVNSNRWLTSVSAMRRAPGGRSKCDNVMANLLVWHTISKCKPSAMVPKSSKIRNSKSVTRADTRLAVTPGELQYPSLQGEGCTEQKVTGRLLLGLPGDQLWLTQNRCCIFGKNPGGSTKTRVTEYEAREVRRFFLGRLVTGRGGSWGFPSR